VPLPVRNKEVVRGRGLWEAVRRWLPGFSSAQRFAFHQENVLGTALELQVETVFREVAEATEERVLAEIDRLERVFSSYNAQSELRRWQERRGEAVPVSGELWEVLTAAERWRKQSGGAFDPATEALTRLWREAATTGCLPGESTIAAVQEKMEGPLWELNEENRTAVCLTALPLTLNAIAKGYIADCACAVAFASPEVDSVVLNLGGDLRIRGRREVGVGVVDPARDAENAEPLSCVRVFEGAVATSGDGRRGFTIGGEWYSHVIDPRSGMPTDAIRSASVLAPDAMTADVLATIFSILSPTESVRLADSFPSVGCLLVARSGETFRSERWRGAEISDTKE